MPNIEYLKYFLKKISGISNMTNVLDSFDERATMRILIALLKGDKNKTTLRDEINGAGMNAINNALDVLTKLELVIEKKVPYYARIYCLTDKGKKAAEIILELKKLMEEERK